MLAGGSLCSPALSIKEQGVREHHLPYRCEGTPLAIQGRGNTTCPTGAREHHLPCRLGEGGNAQHCAQPPSAWVEGNMVGAGSGQISVLAA